MSRSLKGHMNVFCSKAWNPLKHWCCSRSGHVRMSEHWRSFSAGSKPGSLQEILQIVSDTKRAQRVVCVWPDLTPQGRLLFISLCWFESLCLVECVHTEQYSGLSAQSWLLSGQFVSATLSFFPHYKDASGSKLMSGEWNWESSPPSDRERINAVMASAH